MLHHLSGELYECGIGYAVIECGGVGYYLYISGNTASKITTKTGEKVMLYTYMKVSEDAVDLFGFYSEEELSVFKMLISVSGVGAKSAISILSIMTPEKFALAVSSKDAKSISKAQGIGTKIAQRIILELKDKVANNISGEAEAVPYDSESGGGGKIGDVIDTLLVLGYTRREATAALSGIDLDTLSLEEIVRCALKKLAKN